MKVIVILGPTGVGKTKLSIEIAKKLNGEIINADSMQVYKDLNIGTAKIKENEKENIMHHLFNICDINDDYNIYRYQKDCREVIDDIIERKKIPILVGGSGLYIKSALYDYNFNQEEFHDEFNNLSNQEILEQIKLDHDTDIHINNRKRLVRELNKIKNNSVSLNNKDKIIYDSIIIGLTCERNNLYNIIDKRVDNMIKDGLVEEVKDLYDKKVNSKAIMTAIGYKELYKYFNNELSLKESINLIKKNSRNFAKRQYTFYNNQMNVHWIVSNFNCFDSTINETYNYIKSNM